jgi:hypothetical protein
VVAVAGLEVGIVAIGVVVGQGKAVVGCIEVVFVAVAVDSVVGWNCWYIAVVADIFEKGAVVYMGLREE